MQTDPLLIRAPVIANVSFQEMPWMVLLNRGTPLPLPESPGKMVEDTSGGPVERPKEPPKPPVSKAKPYPGNLLLSDKSSWRGI